MYLFQKSQHICSKNLEFQRHDWRLPPPHLILFSIVLAVIARARQRPVELKLQNLNNFQILPQGTPTGKNGHRRSLLLILLYWIVQNLHMTRTFLYEFRYLPHLALLIRFLDGFHFVILIILRLTKLLQNQRIRWQFTQLMQNPNQLWIFFFLTAHTSILLVLI